MLISGVAAEVFPNTMMTAVAVDRDKNSQQAVKWAVDHLVVGSQTLILLNVRNKSSHGFNMAEFSNDSLEAETAEIFIPFRGFCARKGTLLKEVILDEVDVSKALIEYIAANHIHNIVVGASNRNALTRKFRNIDVATSLIKSAPEFCAVYVISKGKALTVRSAKGPPPPSSVPARQLPAPASHHHPPDRMLEYEDSVKAPHGRGSWRAAPPSPPPEKRFFDRNPENFRVPRPRAGSGATPFDNSDSSYRPPRPSSSRDSSDDSSDFSTNLGFQSSDFSESISSHSTESNSESSPVSAPQREMEAEMRRLRLELKQTMDMYSTACKEAITAKQKAKELTQWQVEETRKFEEARQAEEDALAMAEKEKAKCRAALEAAEAAQKIAELEGKRRLNAEMKAKRESEEKKRALDALAHNDVRYRKYSIEEIEIATNYFSESLKIGEGGYGPVYRASLDHTPVAIKVLRPDAQQGRKQFQQEIEVLSCIRHPNMVLLLGACPEYGCLVYEYMDHGSLEDRIFRRGSTPPMSWSVRFKIAAEIATALLFLHQTKPEPLVHRDLKPGNILLDRNYVSKISDVGLARLVPPSVANTVTQYRMTSTAGTFCYIDPEYQQTGMLGIKSDIYSLGVMLLQIITAKPPMGLTHHVERAIDRGTFAELLDPAVTDWPMEETLGYAKLSLKCSELRKKDRPDLGMVILPELNRLRNLGLAYETGQLRSNSSGGGP